MGKVGGCGPTVAAGVALVAVVVVVVEAGLTLIVKLGPLLVVPVLGPDDEEAPAGRFPANTAAACDP